MIERTLVKIYAEALYQLAEGRDSVDTVYEEIQGLEALFRASVEMATYLTSPQVDRKEKKDFIRKVLGTRISKLTLHFLLTLVDRGREIIIPDLAGEFKEILDGIHNRIDVDVTSAVPLEEDLVRSIRESLSRVLGREIILHPRGDPEILGGIIIRVGDMVLDSSLRGQMERLRECLLREERRRVTVNEDSA